MILLALAMAAAPPDGPTKLVIVANNSTVAIDYPTRARCLAAKAEAEAEARRRDEQQRRILNGALADAPLRIIAFCLPG